MWAPFCLPLPLLAHLHTSKSRSWIWRCMPAGSVIPPACCTAVLPPLSRNSKKGTGPSARESGGVEAPAPRTRDCGARASRSRGHVAAPPATAHPHSATGCLASSEGGERSCVTSVMRCRNTMVRLCLTKAQVRQRHSSGVSTGVRPSHPRWTGPRRLPAFSHVREPPYPVGPTILAPVAAFHRPCLIDPIAMSNQAAWRHKSVSNTPEGACYSFGALL